MRYKEVSQLYALLSDETRLRIIKTLYPCHHMTSVQLMEKAQCTMVPFREHVRLLLSAELIIETNENGITYFSCHKEKVNQLATFLLTNQDVKKKKLD